MAFPFTIKYTKQFDRKLTDEETEEMLLVIEDFLLQKSAKNIDVKGNTLTCSGSTAWHNWNIFETIDKGVFTITQHDTGSVITYEIFMYGLFIYVSIAAVLFGVFGVFVGAFWAPLIPIGWVGGMNVIFSYNQHRSMFNEIVEGLDELYHLYEFE